MSAAINMVLHCPQCSTQHIDAPTATWDNPLHRSHLCDCCGFIWRPADVYTNGVASIETKGEHDSPPGEYGDEQRQRDVLMVGEAFYSNNGRDVRRAMSWVWSSAFVHGFQAMKKLR